MVISIYLIIVPLFVGLSQALESSAFSIAIITIIAASPIESSIGWKQFLPRRIRIAEDTPVQTVSGLALPSLPETQTELNQFLYFLK